MVFTDRLISLGWIHKTYFDPQKEPLQNLVAWWIVWTILKGPFSL